MTDISTELPNPLTKAVEANNQAEDALGGDEPNIELAQAWAAIASNWSSMLDPRNPQVRRLMEQRRGR